MNALLGGLDNCATRTGCRCCPSLNQPMPTFGQKADCCGRDFFRDLSVIPRGVASTFRAKSDDHCRRDRC